jgi:hypothetical protein
VTLDEEFASGLETLKLTPAPVGDATIEDGIATFPITGGNVTYYEPGSANPYVRGMIMHDGSGLSLTGGGKEPSSGTSWSTPRTRSSPETSSSTARRPGRTPS